MALNGTNNASALDSPTLDLGTSGKSFTIEAWVYVDPSDVNPWPSSEKRNVAFKNQAYRLYVEFKRKVFAGTDDTSFSFYSSFWWTYTRTGLNWLGGWYHLAAVFDNNADSISLYLDGFRLMNTSFNQDNYNSAATLFIGNGWKGRIDELRFSDTVRYSGPAYNIQTTPFTNDANTIALWHFDEPIGSTSFADSSGNSNTLTGHGGAKTISSNVDGR